MNIGYVLIEDMLATSLTWPSEMWCSAAQFYQSNSANSGFLSKHQAKRVFSTSTIAKHLQPITTQSGLSLMPDQSFSNNSDQQQTYGLIYLPALWRNPFRVLKQNQTLFDWLQFQYEHGATICAVGTGVCLIAETGLLNNKPATTHWYFFDQFAKQYPDIKLKRQHFITSAEPIYCAASINSLADLTVYFIKRYFGDSTAQHVERHFSHEIRKTYDKTNFMDKNNQNHPDETILQVQLWMKDNLGKMIKIHQLAKQFGMSERNFSRRFQNATDLTPNQYLQNIRIETAQDLLQYSNLSIGEIAERTGFNDLSYFAKTFQKLRSITPSEYRKTVRAKLFSQH